MLSIAFSNEFITWKRIFFIFDFKNSVNYVTLPYLYVQECVYHKKNKKIKKREIKRWKKLNIIKFLLIIIYYCKVLTNLYYKKKTINENYIIHKLLF